MTTWRHPCLSVFLFVQKAFGNGYVRPAKRSEEIWITSPALSPSQPEGLDHSSRLTRTESSKSHCGWWWWCVLGEEWRVGVGDRCGSVCQEWDGEVKSSVQSCLSFAYQWFITFLISTEAISSWGFAKLLFSNRRPLMNLIAVESMTRLAAFSGRNLANVTWAFATSTHRDLPLCEALAAVCAARVSTAS